MHFARAARAAKQNPGTRSGSIELDLDPQSFQEAMASPFAREWAIAMEEELEALEKTRPGKKSARCHYTKRHSETNGSTRGS